MNVWHLISAEYPPLSGGVGDYTYQVAAGLARTGDEVHVWCCPSEWPAPSVRGIHVHRELGALGLSDLRRLTRLLDKQPLPRRLMLQWVPHAFGWRSMNVVLCVWLWYRATVKRDQVDIMVHEPFLPFSKRSWRQNAAAVVHRLMTMLLMRTTRRVWISVPAWERRLRPYALGRRISYRWLPVPSTVPVTFSAEEATATRTAVAPDTECIVGHFGTYDRNISLILGRIVPPVLNAKSTAVVLLLGNGGPAWRDAFLSQHPHLSGRIIAPGRLTGHALSCHIAACDVMVQPYPDGITTRRTTAMAALAHGKALVTNSGSLTEPFWAESGIVSLTRTADAQAMAHAVLRLLRYSDERAALCLAAAETYDRRFETGHIVAALRDAVAEDAAA